MRVSLKEAPARIARADRWMDLYSTSVKLSIVIHNGKGDTRASIKIADDYTVDDVEIEAVLDTIAPAE